ncbi:3-oxo-5-alpha-steroid 4-dehydrogenase-domain-containing protein [Halteromyces radiatus]|uniref:3-oxo-5-alpha-steroid 4-dehydrogenase-domain-containing protein n=1 Tax=Halteromyces radiatus TaxID=101107 RepID=UPI00222000E6|nr:3-oxo-5-alpha-steroid 4-dehydrogenase-domain-containing protein [Halteromyces radiatus]KAI8092511.1 3-oxo-5-alpha-steroid 4-dehydrogenase-domain-containing protein [Halteromyces radiatus]
MILICIISGCLLILSCLCLLAKTVPDLRSSVLAYGKLNETADQPRSNWAMELQSLTVPKTWFTHFYAVGFIFSLYCWYELVFLSPLNTTNDLGPLLLLLKYWDAPAGGDRVPWSVCKLGLLLMTCHLARRLYESQVIERPSSLARMHISHYLVGLGFYGAMVFGTWLEGVATLPIWQDHPNVSSNDISFYSMMIGVCLFLYASKHQYQCHVILASLRTTESNNIRKKDKDNRRYRIPHGDWFEIWVAPHYICDILIYLSLCIIYQGRSIILLCGFLWTLLNLSVTASETKSWYVTTFPDFPRQRWILVPGLF